METIWADWKVAKLLGEGSFGKVYEAVRNRFGIEERSAVKVISIPSTPSEANSLRSEGMTDNDITLYYKGVVQDFVQEIALMSKLRGHINIVGYEDYEVVEHKDSFGWDIYIRMELLTPLTARMIKSEGQAASLSEDETARMAIDLCSALEACAAHNIVHRDIKPDNIFVSAAGDYKLGDFGVAKTVEKTVSGLSKKGTYTYMAPEIYKGEPGGLNSDLYSLGIVIYRLLNDGREPFAPPAPQPVSYAQKQEALARRMNGETLTPPAHCSQAMFNIIQKACAYNPAVRYQSPTQMKNDLLALAGKPSEPAKAVVTPVVEDMEKTVAADLSATVSAKTATTVVVPSDTSAKTKIASVNTSVNTSADAVAPQKEKGKSGAKKIVILAIILLAILGIVGGGAIILYQNGVFDDWFGGSSSDKKDEEEEETVLDGFETPEEAIGSIVEVTYSPSVELFKQALPDEVEAYIQEHGTRQLDDELVAYIKEETAGRDKPEYTITVTDIQSTDDLSYAQDLQDCGMDLTNISFVNAVFDVEADGQTNSDVSEVLLVVDDKYFSLNVIDMAMDVCCDNF